MRTIDIATLSFLAGAVVGFIAAFWQTWKADREVDKALGNLTSAVTKVLGDIEKRKGGER